MTPRDWESESDDDEFYEEDFDDDDVDLLPCPQCGVEIYEEAQQCPACGSYIVHPSSNVWSGRSGCWIVIGLLGIIAVILALAFGP